MVQVLQSPNAAHQEIDAGGDGWHIKALGGVGSTDASSAAADTAALAGGLGSSAKLANGGLLKLDAGTYWLTRSLDLVNNLTIRGQGQQSVIKASAAAAALFNVPNNVTKITLRDLVLDGNNGLVNTVFLVGSGTQEIRLERCVLKGGLFNNVQIGGGGAKVVMVDCKTQDVGIAALSVAYVGTGAQCVATVGGSTFTTKVYDGAGAHITADEIPLSGAGSLPYATYATVQQLADAITAFGGGGKYTATVQNSQGAAASSTLSRLSSNCKTTPFVWWVGRRDILAQGALQLIRHTFARTNTNPAPMLDMQSTKVDVLDCEFDGNGTASSAIYIAGIVCGRNKILRNHFENVATSGVAGSTIFCDGTSGTGPRPRLIKVAKNTFYNCNQFGGTFDANGNFSGGATVGGCISFGSCDIDSTGRIGQNLHITGNQAEACGQFIFVGAWWQGAVVEHNQGSNLAPSSTAYPGQNAQGIEVHATSGSVSHNVCDNCGPAGIWVGNNLTSYRNRITATGNVVNATTRAILDAAGLTTVKPYGMVISGPDVVLGDNIITGDKSAGSAAILLQSGAHQDTTQITIASGNKFRSWDYAITYAQTGGFVVGFQVMAGNEFADLLTGPMPTRILTDVASVSAQNGSGLVVRSSGTAVIASASTSIQISHGLTSLNSLSPGDRIRVAVSATNNPTNDPGHLWVSAIDEVHATLNCRADPGVSGLNLVWEAWRGL